MKLKQIRNATMIVTYLGKKFLIDPMLAEKGAYPPFPYTPNQHLNNPIVDLPVPMEEILDVDAVIVTHIHLDHFDEAAMKIIPKDMKIFAQNEIDAKIMADAGFSDVEILTEEGVLFEGIKLTKTPAQHYSDISIIQLYKMLQTAEEACGVMFTSEEEKTLYVMGDTIWFNELNKVFDTYKPEVVVVNAGFARAEDGRYLIMPKEEFLQVVKTAPYANFVATHMEAVNHAMLTRKELKEYAFENGFASKLSIPLDGETCEF